MGNRFVMVKKPAAQPAVQYKAFVKTRTAFESAVAGEALYSWGKIGQGELTMWAKERYHYHTPLEMLDVPVDEIVSIAAGSTHALFATKRGDVYAFGDNKVGCLGYSAEEVDFVDHFHVPRAIGRLCAEKHAVKRVFAGNNVSAALGGDGSLYTWGFPGSYFGGTGALGRRSSKKDYFIPKRVSAAAAGEEEDQEGELKFRDVVVGPQQMLGVGLADGRLWRWGEFGKSTSQGGAGGGSLLLPRAIRNIPFAVKQAVLVPTTSVNGLTCPGAPHVLLLDNEGQVHRVVEASESGSGGGERVERVDGLVDIVQLAAGQLAGHWLALDRFGQVFQSKTANSKPVLVGGEILGKKITKVACGNGFAAAVEGGDGAGSVFAWGDFAAYKCGALGTGQLLERRVYFETDSPKPVADLASFACEEVVCGGTFMLARGVNNKR